MAIFLYTFYDKIDLNVEENRGVPVFLYIFLAKIAESVEENEGMPVFLYTFHENPDFTVEENEGVAIFLYSYDKITLERPKCGVGLRPTIGKKQRRPLRGAPL